MQAYLHTSDRHCVQADNVKYSLRSYTLMSTPAAPLAGPCGDCCARTVQHSGVARGTVEVIANLDTYVSRPHPDIDSTHPRKVILFFADVFGALYINSKLAMDYWAEHGVCPILSSLFPLIGPGKEGPQTRDRDK